VLNLILKVLVRFEWIVFARLEGEFIFPRFSINEGRLLMSVPETIGTLNLKIARLGHRLYVLEQQQALSRAYPTHQINLTLECSQVRLQLERLTQHRQKFLHNEYTGQ